MASAGLAAWDYVAIVTYFVLVLCAGLYVSTYMCPLRLIFQIKLVVLLATFQICELQTV